MSSRSPPRPSGHLHAIDFARGVAALVVLIWHYQHFLMPEAGSAAPLALRDQQPFFSLLWPFYRYGFFAVQFFWMVSGFVFTAVYLPQPSTLRVFFVNRVARLYPLHLLTLLVLVGLQYASLRLTGHEQIYRNNDPYHFVLNLLFASDWGFQTGYSFNGPTWSVSIEVLVYAIFFAVVPVLYRFGAIGPAILAATCWLLHYHSPWQQTDEDLFQCAFYFFEGSSLCVLSAAAVRRPLVIGQVAVALIAAGLLVFVHRPDSLDTLGMPVFLAGILIGFRAVDATRLGHRFEAVRWIGDNTYGSYLWHVPIQVAVLIILDRDVGSRNVALSPIFFLAFILLIVAVSRISFVTFEKPARECIRRLWGQERVDADRRSRPHKGERRVWTSSDQCFSGEPVVGGRRLPMPSPGDDIGFSGLATPSTRSP